MRTFSAGGSGVTVCDADGATRRCDGVDCDGGGGRGSGEDAATDGGGSDGGAAHCDGVEGETELDSHVSMTDGFPT